MSFGRAVLIWKITRLVLAGFYAIAASSAAWPGSTPDAGHGAVGRAPRQRRALILLGQRLSPARSRSPRCSSQSERRSARFPLFWSRSSSRSPRRGHRAELRDRAPGSLRNRAARAAHAPRVVARGGGRGRPGAPARRRRVGGRRRRRRRLSRAVDRVAPPPSSSRTRTSSCWRRSCAATGRAGETAASARPSGATRTGCARWRATPRRSPSAAPPRRPCAGSAPGARRTASTRGSARRRCSRSRRPSPSSAPGTRKCARLPTLGAPDEVVSSWTRRRCARAATPRSSSAARRTA